MCEKKEKLDKVTVSLIVGLVAFIGGFLLGFPIKDEQKKAIEKAESTQQEAEKAKQYYREELHKLEATKQQITVQSAETQKNYERSKIALREANIERDKVKPPTENLQDSQEQLLAKSLEEQQQFHWERRRFFSKYEYADNEIAKSTAFREAGEFTKDFFSKRNNKIIKWKGIIESIDTPHGGDTADVSILAEFWNFPIRFSTYRDTRLQRDTEVYRSLINIPEGEEVLFSAEVLSDDTAKGIKEISWTERGSLKSPEFYMRITEIQSCK